MSSDSPSPPSAPGDPPDGGAVDQSVVMYVRDLPGGGLVLIEGQPGQAGYRARLSVERRCEPRRRDGHAPPVIAEAQGPQPSDVFRELYEIAADNVAVARGLIQWQARRRGG